MEHPRRSVHHPLVVSSTSLSAHRCFIYLFPADIAVHLAGYLMGFTLVILFFCDFYLTRCPASSNHSLSSCLVCLPFFYSMHIISYEHRPWPPQCPDGYLGSSLHLPGSSSSSIRLSHFPHRRVVPSQPVSIPSYLLSLTDVVFQGFCSLG